MKKLFTLINKSNSFEIAGKMYLVFLLIFFSRISHHYFFILIALILFYAIINKKFLTKPLFWLLTSCVIMPGLWTKFYFTGNHTFVTFYIALLFLVASFFATHSKIILIKNAKFLLGIMMFFAIIQKLLSESFMNGSSIAYLNAKGGLFRHVQRFFPENQALIKDNQQLINEQASSAESLSKSIELAPINWFSDFSPSLAVAFILAAELIFFICLFIKNQYLRNSFFILFIIGLIVTRVETGFASLLCILLLLQAQKDHAAFKTAYIAIFTLYISFILTQLGYF